MKTTILKWLLLILIMGYVAWITVWAHEMARKDVCMGFFIEIDGKGKMDSIVKDGLEKELKAYPERIAGTPVVKLDASKIEKYLKRLNMFEDVNCMLTSDNMLLVKAKPMVPVMRVFSGDKSYYINRKGKYIEALPEFFTDVPVVSGDFTKGFTPNVLIPVVRHLENDEFLKNITGMIVARDADNLLLVPRIRGHLVNLGDTSRLDEKSRMLEGFYKRVMPKKGWNEYDTVSVKFKGQIVATRRIKPVVNAPENIDDEVDLEELSIQAMEH